LKAMVAPEMDPVDPQVEGFRDLPLAYQFYRGVELHPRFLGVGKEKLWLCFISISLGTSLYNIWHLVYSIWSLKFRKTAFGLMLIVFGLMTFDLLAFDLTTIMTFCIMAFNQMSFVLM
jgi:hypothetical protein